MEFRYPSSILQNFICKHQDAIKTLYANTFFCKNPDSSVRISCHCEEGCTVLSELGMSPELRTLSLSLPDFLINPSLLASSVNIGPGHNPDNQYSCFFKNKGRIQMLIYFDSIFYIFIGFVKK